MALPNNPASIIGAGGGDYTTVTSWEQALDDAQLDDDYVGNVRDLTADNAEFWFAGVDTTADYEIILQAESGYEADGTDAKGAQIDIRVHTYEQTNINNMTIQGIEFHTAGQIYADNGNADSVINVLKCVFRNAVKGIAIAAGAVAIDVNIGVCLFRDGVDAFNTGIWQNDADPTVKVFNCTGFTLNWGLLAKDAGDFSAIKNCAALNYDVNNAYDDYVNTPSNMSYCASSGDSTATGTGSIDTLRDDGTDFTNTGTNDFTPVSGGVLDGAGNAISGESWFPGTDLAGNAWASPPSMGCFEVAAAGLSINVSESLNATEYIGPDMPLAGVSKSDLINIIESIVSRLSIENLSFETITISELAQALVSVAPSVFEQMTVTEFVSMLVGMGAIDVNDQINITESITAAMELAGIDVFETITLTEYVNMQIEGVIGDLTITGQEIINISEYIVAALPLLTDQSESITIAESITAQLLLSQSVSETMTVTEIVSLILPLVTSVNESITVGQFINVVTEQIMSFYENLTVTEVVSVSIAAIVGYLNVTWDSKAPGFTWIAKKPTMTYTAKRPTIIFTNE